ncbi:MAG: collagen-like protein [Sandaracinaceae bacterium]
MQKTTTPSLAFLLLVPALIIGGCLPRARQHTIHPLPLTAANASQINTGDALVSYLRQRDADPEVCDPNSTGPHFVLVNARDVEDVIDGVGQGVTLAAWQRCVLRLMAHQSPELTQVMLDRLLDRYVERIAYPALDGDPRLLEELDVTRHLYEERPEERDASSDAVDRALAVLREDESFGLQGHAYQQRLLSVLAVERGLLPDGRPVTVADLDQRFEQGNEDELSVFARRIPDQGLRREAARRLIRLRIRSSPFRELAADPSVEERVLSAGRNPIPLDTMPTNARFAPEGLPFRGLLVVQNVAQQSASIMSFRESVENTSVVPAIDLRGAVLFTMPGWSHELTVCAGPESYDPNPCIEAHQLTLGVPFATIEDDGQFHFRETISTDEVIQLARTGNGSFRMPVLSHGRVLVEMAWPLRVRTSSRLVLAPGYGGRGYQVDVDVDATQGNYLYYTVRSGNAEYQAVVDMASVSSFGVSAPGGEGQPGQDGEPGYDGQAGEPGQDAVCGEHRAGSGGPGGNGTDGGNGGDGGDGGPGGLVRATFRCVPATCGLEREVRAGLSAPGGGAGRAGAAGRGGYAGQGGSGGSSASCDGYDMEAGADGPDGQPGQDGYPGNPGRPGPDGRVDLRTARGR